MTNVGRAPSGQALVASDGAELHRLHPSGFDPSRVPYLDRLHPAPPTPNWRDVEQVMAWIEGTRWRAFFGGARHEQISRMEAEALVAALAEQSERTGE